MASEERGSRDKSGMEAGWMVMVLWTIFSCPCSEQRPGILFFAFLFGQLFLLPLPNFPNIEKYINKFTVAWWTSVLNMQIMSLQLQKCFRFFPLFHFFLLSPPPIAASWPKLQVLAKRPNYWKKSNNSLLYVSPIPPPTWSHAHNALSVCLNQTWGFLHAVPRSRWKLRFPLSNILVSQGISAGWPVLPTSKLCSKIAYPSIPP